LEFHTTMTKLALISTFWLLIGAATVLGMPDRSGELRANVQVNTGPKTSEPRQPKSFPFNLQEICGQGQTRGPDKKCRAIVKPGPTNQRQIKDILKSFAVDVGQI